MADIDIQMGNNSSTLSHNGAMDYDDPGGYESVKNALQRYVVPVIIITGLFGNTISFLVFLVSPLKRISTSVYLAALAFSDTGFLVCLGVGWLESLGIRFFHKEGICQMTVFASFVFSFTSIWFVNAFTTEMYVAVFHPRKSPKLCTPANARKVVCSLSIIAAVIYIYTFWIAKLVQTPLSKDKLCLIFPEDAKMAMILSCIDTILTLVVPFTMIMFMITRLLIHISRFYKSETESVVNSSVYESFPTTPDNPDRQANATAFASNPSARQANEAQSKLTRMLVVTVIVFLVLNLPSHAIKVQFLFRSHFSESTVFTETEGFMQVIFQILYYANFSINFLLYSVCGRSFRKALMRTPNGLCSLKCRELLDCTATVQRLTMKTKMTRGSPENERAISEQQHSRLVDIHLNDIRFSQLPSIESQFVYRSPPCLLAFESEQLLESEGGIIPVNNQ